MASLFVAEVQKKVCPHCGSSKAEKSKYYVHNLQVMAAGHYVNGKYRGIADFCNACAVRRILKIQADNGFQDIRSRSGHTMPSWLKVLLGQ